MRADNRWKTGTLESANMSSIPGLPTPGSDVTVLITRVNLNPLCVLVELWGSFSQEKKTDYQCLAQDIQSPGKQFHEFEGNPGDQCLVQVDDTWYRSRIVSRNASNYSVFLIDKGWMHNTTTNMLAWGKKQHFHLPPEVEFCVLSNVLPLSPENKWSPVAVEFLKSLSGKYVTARVQDILVPHRTFVLHIPCISKQMYEMGFARKLSADRFKNFLLETLQYNNGAPGSTETRQNSMRNEPVGPSNQIHKQKLFMYPELLTGTVETVIITEVTNPQRVFCQLKVFSQELKKLTEQITQYYEGRLATCFLSPDMLGSPCAARGSDGRWYRSVLQQVLPNNKAVEVLNVDYGTKQFVQVENVRPLAEEFFRMPVVTYICSLYGLIDRGVGWTANEIDYLKTLLLYKTVIAKFEYQSLSEGVHYVSLYGNENTNLNNLFSSRERSFLECENSLGDFAIRSTAYRRQHPVRKESERNTFASLQAVEDLDEKGISEKLLVEDLPLNSLHVAVVQNVSSPSEFWIQTQKYADEMDKMMASISNLYRDSGNENVVRNPAVGLFCAAKAKDSDFYRAVVSEVSETQIKVFSVDYGNTEVIDRNDIRALPDKFKKLPQLVLKCKLADVKPKDQRWSHSATDFFTKVVTDKVLNVQVTAKYDGGYVVRMTDSAAHGERDISKLMCSSGFAEKDDSQKQPTSRMIVQPATMPAAPSPGITADLHRESGNSLKTSTTIGPTCNESRNAAFQEHMFPIGSTLEVSVSYIESPNDFWCQLVQNAGPLKWLMQDMQTHYACSKYQPFVESACVARHPDNGMWYRALVIHKHVTPQVDVLFVDYGQMKTVSLYDLRKIFPEFLNLKGQAFRCSLYNLADPASTMNDWGEEAMAQFQDFVDTAASNHVILKCTIHAIMYSEQKIVFNVVDLETPFESACTLMANLAKSASPKKVLRSSLCLNTYYYSAHNIKTGTEEKVTVTHVNSVNQFYCQLERNAHVVKDLEMKLNDLCHQLKNAKLPTKIRTVCFAKYTNGLWYRGEIKATQPSILVHFVDYGNTLEVDKSGLLPVPNEASDIISVPVQAVECCLSDIPVNVSTKVNSWFESHVTEREFRALVVAKEPGGRLLVELYYGNIQVNSHIKKKFQIEMHNEEQVVFQGRKALEVSTNNVQKTKTVPKQATEMQDDAQTVKTKQWVFPKPVCQMEDEIKPSKVSQRSAPKPLRHVGENGQKTRAPTLELYRPPHQRQPYGKMPSSAGNGSEPAETHSRPKENNSTDPKSKVVELKSPGPESQQKSYVPPEHKIESLPKLTDLPSKFIASGMEADVFVSHCNSPLSFYVQFVREEDALFSISGKLNDCEPDMKPIDITDLHPGDLLQAEFPDDSSWYRAVVREIHGNAMALVEFVDYGNTAVVPTSKMRRLHKPFLEFPTYSTHCMLSHGAALGKELVLDPDVVLKFQKDVGDDGGKELKCHFNRKSGSVWEVNLEDRGVNVMCNIPAGSPTAFPEIISDKHGQMEEQLVQGPNSRQITPEKSGLKPCPLRYLKRDFVEGQQVEAYITAINNDHTFWCQSADSDEIDMIILSVSEVGDSAQRKPVDADSLSPGSPCIARYAEDELWYRAEIISIEEDMFSVFFVDYGNKSQVNVRDVVEMPPELCEIPAQAFECMLEGFDTSHGSWEDDAADKLSQLLTDQLLLLTVLRLGGGEQGKIRCFVQTECQGQVINETMRPYWKTLTSENKPDAIRPSPYKTTQLPCDSETAAPVAHSPEEHLISETDAFIQSQEEKKEEQCTEELAAPCVAGDAPELSSDLMNGDCSVLNTDGSTRSESLADAQKEDADQISSECSVTVQPDPLTKTERVVKAVPIIEISEAEPGSDHLSYDIGKAQTMSPLCDKGEQDSVNLHAGMNVMESDKDSDEKLEGAMAPDVKQTQKAFSKRCTEAGPQSTETAPTAIGTLVAQEEYGHVDEEECQTVAAELECLPEQLDTHSVESSADSIKYSEFGQLRAAESLPVDSACVVWSSAEKSWCKARILRKLQKCTLVRLLDYDSQMMVDTDSVFEIVLQESDQCDNDGSTDNDRGLSHTEPQADEQKDGSEDNTARDDPVSTEEAEKMAFPEDVGHQANADLRKTFGLTSEESKQVQNESLLFSTGTPVQQLIGATIEQEVETGDVAPQEEVACTPTYDKVLEQKNKSMIEEETLVHQEDEHLVLLADTEPAASEPCTNTVPSQQMDNAVEEVTCTVEEACQADVCTDLIHEAEAEASEQLLQTSPTQDMDVKDDVCAEEMSYSAEDCLDALLSMVTHLSLVIKDSCDDSVILMGDIQHPQQHQD